MNQNNGESKEEDEEEEDQSISSPKYEINFGFQNTYLKKGRAQNGSLKYMAIATTEEMHQA